MLVRPRKTTSCESSTADKSQLVTRKSNAQGLPTKDQVEVKVEVAGLRGCGGTVAYN